MVSQSCAICQGEAAKRCGGCNEVYYCGQDHQRQDWIRHKSVCRPFKVARDEVLGRHLVATRDIKAGEVLLREAPLVQGPSQVTGPVCLGCLQSVSQFNSEPCDHCGWPLCRKPACRQARQHLPECRWTVDKRKTPVKISQFVTPHPTYECVTALRLCYTKAHCPGLWARLAPLQAHTEERRGTDKYQQDTRSVAQLLRRFYRLEDEFTEDEIMDIWGIVQVNGHEVPVTQPQHVAVYDVSSMLEHSCLPNCSKSFSGQGSLVVRAAVPIPRGGHLSICYTDCLWGTTNRLCHLLETKFFTCRCVRCEDVTELGTYFSALTCQNSGCQGAVLPHHLGGLTPDTPWVCRQCGHSLPDSQVDDLLQEVGQELTSLSSKDVYASLRFMDKWKSKFHRNHYFLTEVRLALAQRLGQELQRGIQGLPDELLQLKADLCRQLLTLLAVIAPAEVRLLGVLQFELHACLAEHARRHLVLDPGGLQGTLLESRSCLEQTIYFLQEEPEVLPEGKLLIQAKLNKSELDKTLQTVCERTGGIPAM